MPIFLDVQKFLPLIKIKLPIPNSLENVEENVRNLVENVQFITAIVIRLIT